MPCIFPIGGGKGGIGKSFIAANLGVLLAKMGLKVVLIDLDLGAANLHTFIGQRNPKIGLNEFLSKAFSDLDHVVASTLIQNLYIINSMNCSMEIANLFHAQKQKIIRAIHNLPYDYILLDLGAGTSYNNLDFFLTSDQGLFVVTPEPTAIENTFRFIKSVYFRRIKQIIKQNEFNTLLRSSGDDEKQKIMKSPTYIMEIVGRSDPEKAEMLASHLRKFRFKFILNQIRKHTDDTLGDKIARVCNKHFYSMFEFLGNINYDDKVYDSISAKNIYSNTYPFTSTAMDLKHIVKKMTKNGSSLDPVP
ncbi:MinD/ParA family protein [Thermodesulfobacteriota bacterium]